MKILFVLAFYSANLFASPVIDINYQEHNITGTKVLIDGSGSIDNANLNFNYFWELVDVPEGSQSQIFVESSDKVHINTDRDGIYTAKLELINEIGESKIEYFSIYSTQSVGDVIFGPETHQTSILCKLTFKLSIICSNKSMSRAMGHLPEPFMAFDKLFNSFTRDLIRFINILKLKVWNS